jgi:hypothetical protein
MVTKPIIVCQHINIFSWVPKGARNQDGRTDWLAASYEVTRTLIPVTVVAERRLEDVSFGSPKTLFHTSFRRSQETGWEIRNIRDTWWKSSSSSSSSSSAFHVLCQRLKGLPKYFHPFDQKGEFGISNRIQDWLCRPPSLLSSGYKDLFPWGYGGRGVKLTTHLHYYRGKNAWNYTSTPQYAFMAWC